MNRFHSPRVPIGCLSAIVLVLCATLTTQAQQTFRITGDVPKPGEWSLDRIKSDLADQIKPLEYTSHGQTRHTRAVALLAILKAAGAPTELKMDPNADPKVKNFALRFIVVVQGRDGYTAAFSLGELLSEVGKRDAWLAIEGDDGAPLNEKESPVRLISPEDAKPARWVRGVGTITVIDTTAAATTRPST